ncbi:DUF6002 family protein [Streptomyces sp. NPDC007063]|uniref:DUF6002 family protein n=1 Tax=Streptomyces sp. NPDC007063 TaxID=3364772 RepID=UPI003695B4C1
MTLTARTGPAARIRSAEPPGETAPWEGQPLTDHWDTVRALVRSAHRRRAGPGPGDGRDPAGFVPYAELPALDGPLRGYLAAAGTRVTRLPDHRGVRWQLFDHCTASEGRTAQPDAALLLIARAVQHTRRTGRRIALLAPSSGNLASALREALLRAHRYGLAQPDQVRVIALVPAAARHRVADSPLARHPELRRRNPLVVHHGAEPGSVHELAAAYCRAHARALHTGTGTALWYIRDPVEHRAAAALRAFVERDALGAAPAAGRVHAQTADTGSAALGHRAGSVLAADGAADTAGPRPLLVQQPRTCGLVLRLLTGSCSLEGAPRYRYDAARRLYHQAVGTPDPHFPRTAHHPEEVVEPAFFTRAPGTAPEVSALLRAHGGTGIVVSRYECLARYPSLRALLAPAGVALPADPARLADWSLVMALTGALNAAERGLPAAPEVVVHRTAAHSAADRAPVPGPLARYADSADELHAVLTGALDDRGRSW